jgi:N-acetylneuraminic acid mutarotase
MKAMIRHTTRTMVTHVTLVALAVSAALLARPSLEPAAAQTWVPLKPSLLARAESATAVVGKDIYIAGGFLSPTYQVRTTEQVERYDTVRDQWQLVKSMPLALNHASAVSYGGQLYVLGGYTNGFASLTGAALLANSSDAFLRYDPETDSWSEMPRMPIARETPAAAVIGDKLYVVGGRSLPLITSYTTSMGLLKRLDIFDFTTGEWTPGPDMAIAREHVAGAVADGAFYALGGRSSFDQGVGAVPAVERYIPSQRRWERVADMSVAHNGFGAVTVGGRIIVFGGEEPSTPQLALQNEVTEAFDPATGHWSALPDMRTPRGALGGAAIRNRVYAIEGIIGPYTQGPRFSNIVEALDIAGPS